MKNIAIAAGLIFLVAVALTFRKPGGQGWFRPMLGQPMPPLIIEKWLTPPPDTKGKFVLVDFWATWCPPCIKGIPELNRIQEKFAGKLVVIGLAENTIEQIRAFPGPPIKYAIAVDPTARLKDQMGILGIPHAVLVDPRGVIRYEGSPAFPGEQLTDARIEEIIARYGSSAR